MKTTLNEVLLYLDTVDDEQYVNREKGFENVLGNHVLFLKEGFQDNELKPGQIVIIGVNEDRGGINNRGCTVAPSQIRNKLYRYFYHTEGIKIADAGNIKAGFTVNDTYFALSETLAVLLRMKTVPVILGGTHDLTYAIYKAYEKLGKVFNLVSVDQTFDIFTADNTLNSRSFLSEILVNRPNFLFNYTNIGYQSYLNDPASVKAMEKLFFDVFRLGEVRAHIEEMEPVMRNADVVTFDINAVRNADAPGNPFSGPNGFYGEEICQISRYAGLSDRLSCAGFFEFNPDFDHKGQTAELMAQMIWYFMEGLSLRKQEMNFSNPEEYSRYIVPIENHSDNLVFIKSKTTDRWWMEVPVSEGKKTRYERFYHIPCTYSDYEQAGNGDIPDRWWKAYQKLM